MSHAVTISADLAHEIESVLASLSGFALGTARAIPSLEPTAKPLAARADAIADQMRPLLARALASAIETGVRQ